MGSSARRKRGDKRRSTDDDDSLLLKATEILACMLDVGGGNDILPKDDHSIDIGEDILLLRKNGILGRNKFSLAADTYVKKRQALSKRQHGETKEYESALQELEESSFHLQTTSRELVLIGEKEREILVHRLLKRLRTLSRNGGDYCTFVTQTATFARFLVDQHYRQIQFEKIASLKIVEIIKSQYDDHVPERNSSKEIQLRLQEFNKVKYYADGVRLRVHLDRLEWKNIELFVRKGIAKSYIKSCSPEILFDGPPNIPTKPIININGNISTTVGSSKSPEEAIHHFLHVNVGQQDSDNQNALILLRGEKGCGKTYFCDEITRSSTLNKSCPNEFPEVLRPEMPSDMLRNTIGSAVDILLSLFASAKEISKTKRCILILENIDILLGDSSTELEPLSDSSLEQTLTLSMNLRSTLTSVLRSLKEETYRYNGILLVCTSTEEIPGFCDWFDAIFTLERPAYQQRHDIIIKCLKLSTLDIHLFSDVSRLATYTTGRSVAEMSSFCRTVLSTFFEQKNTQISQRDADKRKLLLLECVLKGTNAEAVSSGLLSGVVDVAVEGSKELLPSDYNSRSADERSYHLRSPLFGDQARAAWERLESMIIYPLCRSTELEELLYGNDSRYISGYGSKVVCAGALLVGPTGTGKSTLARHCAAVAASINPSIKLLTVSCTSLVHKEVGGSERALKHLFRAAKSSAPCILLLDGIENIAPVRGNDNTTEGTMDRLVSTLLIEIDGIDDGSVENRGRVAVIGTTHNPEWIDPALRRPGRLDNFIELSVPDDKTRSEIAMREVQKMPIEFSDASDKEKLVFYISSQSHGWNAADVMALCSDAAFARLRELVEIDQCPNRNGTAERAPVVQRRHFMAAMKHRKHCSLR